MKNNSEKIRSIHLLDAVLLGSFFLSGCCALIYQVGWQRSLYSIIGVDIDSITIVVSVFMLGIGFGGMLGGWIADRAPRQRIQFYAAAEVSIALYGFSSLALLQSMGTWLTVTGGSALWSGVASFLFLIVPTILMGITLPLLTMAFNEWKKKHWRIGGTVVFFQYMGCRYRSRPGAFCSFATLVIRPSNPSGCFRKHTGGGSRDIFLWSASCA